MFAAEEGVYFAEGVVGVIEAAEEALLALVAELGGFEFVDVGAADLVELLDLNGIPVIRALPARNLAQGPCASLNGAPCVENPSTGCGKNGGSLYCLATHNYPAVTFSWPVFSLTPSVSSLASGTVVSSRDRDDMPWASSSIVGVSAPG